MIVMGSICLASHFFTLVLSPSAQCVSVVSFRIKGTEVVVPSTVNNEEISTCLHLIILKGADCQRRGSPGKTVILQGHLWAED